ncbi:MAG: hypothetical protein ABIO04_07340 [Ferruginibacter sp.]
MNATGRFLLPLLLLFLIITITVFISGNALKQQHVDGYVLLGANLLFFMVSILSFFMQRKGLHNKNPHVFVRTVTAAMLLKMVACIAGVIAYVYISGNSFNKKGVFIALFLYLVYLGIEVYVVMKMNKQTKANV